MPYRMKLGNILDSNDDAIINSLGIHTNTYGRLCKSIITGSKSLELKNYIDNLGNVNVLDTFITKGYSLNTKNIIHIITPFKKNDPNCVQLTKAYMTLINKAIENGFKSLSIAFIGTGANGYNDVEASDAISRAVDQLISEEEKKEKEILTITLYVKPKTKQEVLDEIKAVRSEISYDEMLKIKNSGPFSNTIRLLEDNHLFSNERIQFINYYKYRLKTNSIRMSDKIKLANYTLSDRNLDSYGIVDLVDKSGTIKHPYDFVDSYVYKNEQLWKDRGEKKSTARLNEAGVDKKKRNLFRNGTIIREKDLYSMAFTLNMNKEELFTFMLINNTTFNPLNEHSLFFMEFINGIYGTINTFQELIEKADAVYEINFGDVLK